MTVWILYIFNLTLYMSHHEKLKPNKVKEKNCISDNFFIETVFLFTNLGFFRFKDLFLKNARHFIVDSARYIFSG